MEDVHLLEIKHKDLFIIRWNQIQVVLRVPYTLHTVICVFFLISEKIVCFAIHFFVCNLWIISSCRLLMSVPLVIKWLKVYGASEHFVYLDFKMSLFELQSRTHVRLGQKILKYFHNYNLAMSFIPNLYRPLTIWPP